METIAAIATPPGTGGIAVIRISGPDAFAVAECVFVPADARRSVARAKGYTAMYGAIVRAEGGNGTSAIPKTAEEGPDNTGKNNDNKHINKIDDAVALFFRAPHSYTGENVVELSCHGGPVVTRQVLAACIKAGARPAQAGEFTRRAVLNGRISLTEAEGVMELISAASNKGAALALSAKDGALHRQIVGMKEKLVSLAAHLAAWTDYPDEDVEELDAGVFTGTLAEVRGQLDGLIENFHRGSMVTRGVATVIVGSPNVGKSTLFNLLSGQQHAIVTPIAGTTRDVVRQQIQLGGIPLNLADTAGLHESSDIVEAEGIRRSWRELETADLILAVFDGSQPLDARAEELARKCAGRCALAIVNKEDLGLALDPAALAPWFKKVLVVSAASHETNDNTKDYMGDISHNNPCNNPEKNTLETMEQAMMELLELTGLDVDAAHLANQRQLDAAVRARDALADGLAAFAAGLTYDAAGVCLDDAIRALAALTGEDPTEAMLEEVFSRFCVGK